MTADDALAYAGTVLQFIDRVGLTDVWNDFQAAQDAVTKDRLIADTRLRLSPRF